MCIRDSSLGVALADELVGHLAAVHIPKTVDILKSEQHSCCLLYTSDAADERSSVDLGGRRIIKKKNRKTMHSKVLCPVYHHIPLRLYHILYALLPDTLDYTGGQ